MRLSDLETGQSAVIIKILGHGAFRHRVMEMGLVKGREISAVLNAPLRDPVKYRLMGYEVSLRRSEASMIEIVPVDEYVESEKDSICDVVVVDNCIRRSVVSTLAVEQFIENFIGHIIVERPRNVQFLRTIQRCFNGLM